MPCHSTTHFTFCKRMIIFSLPLVFCCRYMFIFIFHLMWTELWFFTNHIFSFYKDFNFTITIIGIWNKSILIAYPNFRHDPWNISLFWKTFLQLYFESLFTYWVSKPHQAYLFIFFYNGDRSIVDDLADIFYLFIFEKTLVQILKFFKFFNRV